MDTQKMIKHILLEKGMSVKDLAERFGIKAQSMSTKLYRNALSVDEFVKIADILGCDVKIVMRDTGKEFWDRLTQVASRPKPKQKQPAPVEPEPPPLPTGAESPKPEPKTRRSLPPAPEEPQDGQEKTSLEKFEEALAERRRQEPDADWEFREKLHEQYRKKREEGIEMRRKLREEHENLLRKRAAEASKEENDEIPDDKEL
jgi:transcriptional regulator with XRE-family HTH domain